MKSLFLGIAIIILVGIGGFVYRNAVEHSQQPIACPQDAKLCPDGTAVSRTSLACEFSACPFPNVSLADAGIAFAVPPGFASTTPAPDAGIASYLSGSAASSTAAIVIRQYAIEASSTASEVIKQTAIGGVSGMPVAASAVSSLVFGDRRYTVVTIERFEGVIDRAFYLTRGTDVMRFDAIDTGVLGWTDSNLDVMALPAETALTALLANMQVL